MTNYKEQLKHLLLEVMPGADSIQPPAGMSISELRSWLKGQEQKHLSLLMQETREVFSELGLTENGLEGLQCKEEDSAPRRFSLQEKKDEILAVLAASDRPMKASEIGRALDARGMHLIHANRYHTLSRLVENGQIIRTDNPGGDLFALV